MSCEVCLRDHSGLGFYDPGQGPFVSKKVQHACSTACLDIIHHYWKVDDVLTPTNYEQQALITAGEKGGAYLESIQKTDLAQMSQEEWRTFLLTIFDTTTSEIRRLADENAIPF